MPLCLSWSSNVPSLKRQSGDKTISESLLLDDSEKGVIIKGITDDTIAAKSGLQAGNTGKSLCFPAGWLTTADELLLLLSVSGDEIVAATVHLDHLKKNDVLKILKALEPYDGNMKVLTKKEVGVPGLGSLGLDPAEVNTNKHTRRLDEVVLRSHCSQSEQHGEDASVLATLTLQSSPAVGRTGSH